MVILENSSGCLMAFGVKNLPTAEAPEREIEVELLVTSLGAQSKTYVKPCEGDTYVNSAYKNVPQKETKNLVEYYVMLEDKHLTGSPQYFFNQKLKCGIFNL